MDPHRTGHVRVLLEIDVLKREGTVLVARSRLNDRTNVIIFGVMTVPNDQILQSKWAIPNRRQSGGSGCVSGLCLIRKSACARGQVIEALREVSETIECPTVRFQ